jgi:hypothetical protein
MTDLRRKGRKLHHFLRERHIYAWQRQNDGRANDMKEQGRLQLGRTHLGNNGFDISILPVIVKSGLQKVAIRGQSSRK